jgi:hypothetical protein
LCLAEKQRRLGGEKISMVAGFKESTIFFAFIEPFITLNLLLLLFKDINICGIFQQLQADLQ